MSNRCDAEKMATGDSLSLSLILSLERERMNRRFPSPTICGGEGTREGPPGSGQAGLFWFSNPSKSPTGVEILSQSGPGVCVLVSGVNPDDGRLIGVVWQGVARCCVVWCVGEAADDKTKRDYRLHLAPSASTN